MKILQINEKDGSGGAAVCMMRLHRALRRAGEDASVLVARPELDPPDPGRSVIRRQPLWSRFCFHSLNQLGLNFAGIRGVRRLVEHPRFLAADVVHLHNLHGGYFNYLWLPELSRLKPVVWTLHDMWGLTGHCSHSLDCDRWVQGCGRCPYPETYPAVRRDATGWEWRLKRRAYAGSRLTLIAPSAWLADITSRSMLKDFPRETIANGVDLGLYSPRGGETRGKNPEAAPGSFVILFVAKSVDDPFKDFALLREALRMLEPGIARRCTLLLMGADTRSVEGDFGQVQVRSLGYVADERGRAEAYRSADMLAYPTRADNQPLVLIEAMACGLPAVACDVGGVGELVRNGRNGYLAPPGDAGAFCEGIRRLALDEAAREDLARACREDAEREFGEKAWVDLMRELYSRTLDSWRRS